MADARVLQAALAEGKCCIGEVAISRLADGYRLTHREDAHRGGLRALNSITDAARLAKFDDAGVYRPLKTAPNLAHGWQLTLSALDQVCLALDYFYPGRLQVLAAAKSGRLKATPIRETLERQTGMYRVAAKISDEELNELIANFCRSNDGCLRTILWRRDNSGAPASTKLPPEKFDPACDQTGRQETAMPLLCQEACNLLVAECRKVVKMEGDGHAETE